MCSKGEFNLNEMTQTVLPATLLQIRPGIPEEYEINLWIAVVVILFVLSLISERITYFVKLHSPSLRKRSSDKVIENRRQKSLLYLELFVGISTTLLIPLLFSIIVNKNISTTGIYKISHIYVILGLFFFGLAISFVAKFWHSTLELLSYFSSLKMYQSLDQSQDHLKIRKEELTKLAKTLSPRFQGLKGYTKYEVVEYYDGRSKIQFCFSPKELNMPTSIQELQERIGNTLEDYEILLKS